MHEPDFAPEEMDPGLVGFIYLVVGALVAVVGMAVTSVFPTAGEVVVGLGIVVMIGSILLTGTLWWTEKRGGSDSAR